MKNFVRLGRLATTMALVIAVTSATAAHAARAVVVQDAGCIMLNTTGANVVVSLESNSVGTDSTNCNAMVQCKAKITNTTKKTIKFSGATLPSIQCSTIYGLTQDWQQVISASGSSTLVCHFNTCE